MGSEVATPLVMRRITTASWLLVLGCSRAEGSHRGDVKPPVEQNVTQRVTETSEKAEVTPELAERAQRILEEHAEDPVGTEVPFSLNGRAYVARIEMHDNPEGSPDRPQGEHKGVTVYVAR